MTSDQRRCLEEEARRQGTSVASLIREAVDARFGGVTRADRQQALQEIRAMKGCLLSPDELNRLAAEEREVELRRVLDPDGT